MEYYLGSVAQSLGSPMKKTNASLDNVAVLVNSKPGAILVHVVPFSQSFSLI